MTMKRKMIRFGFYRKMYKIAKKARFFPRFFYFYQLTIYINSDNMLVRKNNYK